MTPSDPIDRIFNRITITRIGCWECGYRPNTKGYVQVGDSRSGKCKFVLAHRVVWEHFNGPIPEGLELDHLCRVHNCVNPAHLEPVTRRENLKRGETFTARNLAKTHCPHDHPYDEANTYFDKKGGRSCRACWTVRNRERAAR